MPLTDVTQQIAVNDENKTRALVYCWMPFSIWWPCLGRFVAKPSLKEATLTAIAEAGLLAVAMKGFCPEALSEYKGPSSGRIYAWRRR